MLGEYHYRVDCNRVCLPPRCRERFRQGITLCYVPEDGCLAGWARIPENLSLTTLDSRGRITIPQKLREMAGIQDTVVILLDGEDYLELWGEKNWQSELEAARCLCVKTNKIYPTRCRPPQRRKRRV